MTTARSPLAERALGELPQIVRANAEQWERINEDAEIHAAKGDPLPRVHFCEDSIDRTGELLVGYWANEQPLQRPVVPATGNTAIQGCFAGSAN